MWASQAGTAAGAHGRAGPWVQPAPALEGFCGYQWFFTRVAWAGRAGAR